MSAVMISTAPEVSPGRAARWKTKRRRRIVQHTVLHVVLTISLILTLLPFVWMVLGSVKTQAELMQRPITWWPQHPTLQNFVEWFTELDFPRYLTNSVVVSVVVVLGNLVFCSMMGYALAKMEFPGKKLIFGIVMVMLMVPAVVTMIPLFVLVANMGMVNTYWGLILPSLATPFGVFLMRQFMQSIPESLIEAARVDGASELRIFAQILMPMSGPPLATLGVFTFLGSWNSFLWPLVVAQDSHMYTLPVALSLFSVGKLGPEYGTVMAGAVLIIAPVLVLFAFLQKYFVQGMATAGLK
ncbi:MAG: carbohydrate ABC transporter permease [Ancrocorticia sp.]|nr:carbohydrate ABC transporter permease [Ancrocorticia sp.]MCI2192662.1 carbohydrate ABC transporter permease [Ancrocorticia sp.]MCI2199272.1 carbohydrate ABC transporter permease [Ancrocorticia sp.]